MTTIRIRRSTTAVAFPALEEGEPAHSEALPGQIAVGTTGANDVIRTFPAAAEAKLNAIDAGATDDMTGAEIKAAYEAEANTNGYTDAEKTKLAGLEEGKFKGRFTGADFPAALAALAAAEPTPPSGSTAEISDGATVKTAVWDGANWVEDPAATPGETAASVKTKYESNADTNAFTDADETKLDGIEAGATGDMTGAEIVTAAEGQPDKNFVTDAQLTTLGNAVTLNTHIGQTDTPAAYGGANFLVAINGTNNGLVHVDSIDGGTF